MKREEGRICSFFTKVSVVFLLLRLPKAWSEAIMHYAKPYKTWKMLDGKPEYARFLHKCPWVSCCCGCRRHGTKLLHHASALKNLEDLGRQAR